MEILLLNISLTLFVIFFYQRVRKGLHILQLENYYNDRYAVWMKKNIKKVLDFKVIGLMAIPAFLIFIDQRIVGLSLEIIAFLTLIFTFKKAIEKKPFVVTARIRRMYVTDALIVLALFICANLFDYKWAILATNIIAILAYTFVYIVNLVNRPVEKLIRHKFIVQAKKKLKDNPYLKIVGITGSYGKTSTKYAINTILSQKYNTLMTPASYNTTMGVVRTINENLSSTHQVFICEMGAKYVGDIKEICDIVKPRYGALTAIGPQHLDTFKSLDNVRKTKLELIDSLPDSVGLAFVNWEDENIRNSEITKKMVKYGLSKEADYYADNIKITEKGSTFDVIIPDKDPINIKTRLLGELNILNIVCAVAIADKLGLSEREIKLGAKYLRAVPHRLELKQNPNGSIIIDDAYNSNVKGANMALDVLKSFENRKKILITPGIVELGEKSEEINKNLGKKAAESADYIILVGAKQTIRIYEGIKEKKYPEGKVFIAKDLNEALVKMKEEMTEKSVILLENDLPDNYL